MYTNKLIGQSVKFRFFEELDCCFPKLREDKYFTLKDICSDKYWNSLSKSEKTQLGVLFSDLHIHQSFGVKFVQKAGKRNLYRLI